MRCSAPRHGVDFVPYPPQLVRGIRVVLAVTNISGVDGTVLGVPLGVAVEIAGFLHMIAAREG